MKRTFRIEPSFPQIKLQKPLISSCELPSASNASLKVSGQNVFSNMPKCLYIHLLLLKSKVINQLLCDEQRIQVIKQIANSSKNIRPVCRSDRSQEFIHLCLKV